jgi:hypothetical protein
MGALRFFFGFMSGPRASGAVDGAVLLLGDDGYTRKQSNIFSRGHGSSTEKFSLTVDVEVTAAFAINTRCSRRLFRCSANAFIPSLCFVPAAVSLITSNCAIITLGATT